MKVQKCLLFFFFSVLFVLTTRTRSYFTITETFKCKLFPKAILNTELSSDKLFCYGHKYYLFVYCPYISWYLYVCVLLFLFCPLNAEHPLCERNVKKVCYRSVASYAERYAFFQSSKVTAKRELPSCLYRQLWRI